MQYHEKIHGISHWSIIGGVAWKLFKVKVHEDWPSINGPPTTTNNSGNWQHRVKYHIECNRKTKIYRSIDMIFYWVRDIIEQNKFHILWEEGNKNLVDYVTKHLSKWHHRTMPPRYLKQTNKRHRKLKIPENWDRNMVWWDYWSQGNLETG